MGSGADGKNLNEIDSNNSELCCQIKLPKLPSCTLSKLSSIVAYSAYTTHTFAQLCTGYLYVIPNFFIYHLLFSIELAVSNSWVSPYKSVDIKSENRKILSHKNHCFLCGAHL